MKATRRLYGTDVPAKLYHIIEQVTETLARQTDTRIYLSDARKVAVRIALRAVKDMDKAERKLHKEMKRINKLLKF